MSPRDVQRASQSGAKGLDPISLEVLRGRLDSIANEMQDVLLRSSFSTIVTESGDATAAVFDRHGRTAAQACAIPIHLGTMAALGRRFAETYPEGRAKEGDVYIINDPYDGGTHLPDIAVAAPVFSQDRLAGYVATMSHHQDIGGVAPGSVAPNPYDLLAEGIRIPLIRLASAGVLDEELIELLAANSRSPLNVKGDLAGQIASCETGRRRLQALCTKMGAQLLEAGLDELMNYAERLSRAAIDSIPDGSYEFVDWLDDDGISADAPPPKVSVKIGVSGSNISFDFTGTSPQVKSSINNVKSSSMSAVYFAIRTLTGDSAPNNDGCFRPISVIMPPGTLLNAVFPAPVAARGVGLVRVMDVIQGALAKAIPSKMTAAGSGHATVLPAGGSDPATGERFMGSLGGPLRSGTGARSTKDGLDVSDHSLSNAYHIPIEIAEARLPLLYHCLELWTDSGGAGQWRGGLGFWTEVKWLRGEATISLRLERQRFHPYGIQGGGPSPLCRVELVHADGAVESPYGKTVIAIRAGDVLRYWSTGGGGFGSPLARKPKLVLDDVLDGKVSVEAARELYGVVIAGKAILESETAEMRARLEKQVRSPAHDSSADASAT